MKKNSLVFHNGTSPESIFQFFQDKITLYEEKLLMEFEYYQIKTIKEYETTYVLMIGKKNRLLLVKNSFTVGNFQD